VAAVLRTPVGTVFKALYGQAFRSPALYEVTAGESSLNPGPELRPEQIRAFELVAEQRLRSVSLRVSLFNEHFTGLIEPAADPVDTIFSYTNLGRLRTRGVEAELTAARGGWLLRAGAAALSARDEGGGDDPPAELTNAPAYSLRAALNGPLAPHLSIGTRVSAESGRLTLAGARTSPFAVADLSLTLRPRDRLRMSLLTTNLLDAAYFHPGRVEHRQDRIRQDGRKLDLRVEYVW
jgi:vitamin B12 transporter